MIIVTEQRSDVIHIEVCVCVCVCVCIESGLFTLSVLSEKFEKCV